MGSLISKVRTIMVLPMTGSNLVKWYLLFALGSALRKLGKTMWRIIKFKQAVAHLPGNRPDFTGELVRKNMLRVNDFAHEELRDHYGKPFVTWSMPECELVANNSDAVKFLLLNEFKHFTKPTGEEDLVFRLMRELIGVSVFTALHGQEAHPREHESWNRQRKQVSQIFSKRKMMDEMYPVFLQKSQRLAAILGNETEETVVDMQGLFNRFTYDSISKVFFGLDVNSLGNGQDDRLAKSFDEAHRSMLKYYYKGMSYKAIKDTVMPFPFGEIMMQLQESTDGDYRDFKFHASNVNEEVDKVVQSILANGSNNKALLSHLCENIPPKELGPVVKTVILAGKDTTANLLSWLFYELALNPEVQTKLYEEIESRYDANGKPPSYDVLIQEMPYLDAVVLETLRLHPPIPYNTKVAQKDLQYDDLLIPRGTRVNYAPYVLNRDPNKYKNPSQFFPERWIGQKQPSLFEFPVFQAGPRFCLGKDMSKFETKLLTTVLLHEFSFTIDAAYAKGITYSLMLTMSICDDLKTNSHKLLLKPMKRR